MNNNMNNQVVPNGQPNMGQPSVPTGAVPQPIPVQPQMVQQPMINQPVPQPMPVQPQMMQQPTMNAQPMQPQMVNPQPMIQPTMQPQTTIGPQFATPVAPIGNEVTKEVTLEQEIVPTQDIQTSVVEENLSPSNTEQFNEDANADALTIDYNQLYNVNNEVKEEVVVEENNDRHVFTEQEIVIETPSIIERQNTDVTPEFNINALDTTNQDTDNKVTDNILSEKQQDRADTRRKIMYLVVLFLLIAVCLIWIFPMLAGVK